jgi:hypothetical protein
VDENPFADYSVALANRSTAACASENAHARRHDRTLTAPPTYRPEPVHERRGVAVRRRRLQLAAVVAVVGLLGVVAAAVAGGGSRDVREHLTGYEETLQTLSTTGSGDFRAKVRDSQIEYRLSYGGLEGDVQQAHIHLGREATTGGVSAFLCSNLGNGPAGTPACPGLRSGAVEGTIEPADVIGPTGQGIAPGEYAELLRAIGAGATYANVHSTKYPDGEIRAQLERGRDR